MKASRKVRIAGLLAITAISGALAPSALAALDLTTAGASGDIGGAKFVQVPDQSTGTGVINPFVRIQSTGNEGGYNTSAGNPPFDAKQGAWTRDLPLSSLTPVQYQGAGSYYCFLLDINQTGANSLLSLNQVQIFQTSVAGQTGGAIDPLTGRVSGLTGTSVYDMNSGGGTANSVLLDYSLNPGSGAGDMKLFVPTSAFGNGQYVVLYSHFGDPPGTAKSNDGFEEWAALTPVPEPTTMIAGALLLLPFGVSTFRLLRNKRA